MAVPNLGAVWYSVVHLGTKGGGGKRADMEFEVLFPVLRKHLSDGMDVPEFFREFVALITDVSEKDWGTTKDPSNKLTRESTLRSYAKRGLTGKFARSIVYRLTLENLVEYIDDRPEATRIGLAQDLHGYNPNIEADNVSQIIADWVCEIIQTAAGVIKQDELDAHRQQKLSDDLKKKYGSYLLNEENEHCPFPGCGRLLVQTGAGRVAPVYEVGLIDREKPPELNNLLAMCPRCHAIYTVDDDKKIRKELHTIKTVLVAHMLSGRMLDDLPLEKGIIGVVRKVTALKEKDLYDAELDPKELKQKISPSDDMALYMMVKTYVTTYFIRLKEIMTSLDKRGEIDYEAMQDQMHALYKRLKKSKKTSVEIFSEIVEKVHHVSLQDDIYCQIVVSYFIQSCEVFDAIS